MFLIFGFFLMISKVDAVKMECPTVASPSENINIHISDSELNGLKTKYNFGNNFIYKNTDVSGGSKVYYDASDGFAVGNVANQSGIDVNISIMVGFDIVANRDYTLSLTDISGSNKEFKSINVDNISCNVRIVNDINTLDSLEIDGVKLDPSFSKNVTNYQGTTTRDKINIKAIASDSGAKIDGNIGEQKLNFGANEFNIRVTSARGSVREYKIYIVREFSKKDVSSSNGMSNDATLRSLILSKGKLNFKKDTFLYRINVDNSVDDIEVKAIANSDKALVKIDKPDKLEVGENTIKIKVTAEDGTTITYIVVVNRKKKLSSDNSIKSLKIKDYNIDFKSDVYKYKLDIKGEDKLDIKVILNDDKAKYRINGNKNLDSSSVISIIVIAEDGSEQIYKIFINKLGESNTGNVFNNFSLISIIAFILLIIVILVIKFLKSRIFRKKVNEE